MPPDPDANWNQSEEDSDWEGAAEQCQTIYDKIEDASGDLWDKAFEFFESVQEKVKSMKGTIESTKRVSEAQKTALDNMEGGVDKWLEKDE